MNNRRKLRKAMKYIYRKNIPKTIAFVLFIFLYPIILLLDCTALLNEPDRGLLRVGNWADVVIFDPERVASKATYLTLHQFPIGVEWAIVNGVITVEEGKHTGTRAGKVLRK